MSESSLALTLQNAQKAASTSEALGHLREAERVLNTHPSPGSLVNTTILTALSKLTNKYQYQLMRFIVPIYSKLCLCAPRDNPNLLITLCNDVLLLSENQLGGSEMGEELGVAVKDLLVFLIQSGSLDSEQLQIAQNLLDKKPEVNFEEALEPVTQELKDTNPYAINRIMDLFSSFRSLKDQLFYFGTQLNSVLELLRENKDREILAKLLRFLEHFIFQVNFNIQVTGHDSLGAQYSHLYTSAHSKYLHQYEDVFYTAVKIVKLIITSDTLLTQNLVLILQRLWFIYPQHRSGLHDLVFDNLKEIAAGGSEFYKKAAARFLYRVMHIQQVEGEFKGRLENDPVLESLFKHECYDEEAMKDLYEAEEPVEMDELKLMAGFPLAAMVPASDSFFYLVEVTEPNCILSWGFATEYYDLGFYITRVDLAEPEVIESQERVKCDDSPVAGIRLVQSPGLYKFQWDNSFSWFRSKHLRFRVEVLKPHSSVHSPVKTKETYKVINIVQQDEIGDMCYATGSVSVLEVGVYLSETSMSISAYNNKQEMILDSEQDIPLAIAGFIESNTKHFDQPQIVKVGIVEKEPKARDNLEDLGAVAVARDVDAIALLSQQSLHSHTLIAVMNEGGLRSSVVHRGRLLVSESGVPLGDISKVPNQDPVQGIAQLLCMFGPAVVVVAGTDSMGSLVDRVKPLVPEGIWKESLIRESVSVSSIALEAAAKLHFLHYKYKFTF